MYGLTKSVDIESSTPDYLEAADSATLSPTGSFTLELAVNFESLPSAGNVCTFISKRQASGNQRSYWFYMYNDGGNYRLQLQVSGNGTDPYDIPSNMYWSGVTTGVWYRIAVTFTGGTGAVQFVVEGVDAGTGTSGPTSIYDGTAPLYLGNRYEGGSGDPFDGKMSLVRVWKGVTRSISDIANDACSVLGTTTNLSAEWTLDDVYTDNSGNSNTLTPHGSPTFTADLPAVCLPSVPGVDTGAATDIETDSAVLNGEITDEGADTPDERGFVWGTSSQADPGDVAPASAGYDDYETDSGSFGTGTFDTTATGLDSDTTYYARAYAHNSAGYSYGPEVSFDTDAPPAFRFTNLPGVDFDPDDTTTIYAERLNDILERLEALE